VEFLEPFKAFVSMEDRIDRLQRPILVDDDAITKEPRPVKQCAVVVQGIKQGGRVAHSANFVADAVKFLSFQQTTLPFRFVLLVFLDYLSQTVAHL
jgi:hypothetical protein